MYWDISKDVWQGKNLGFFISLNVQWWGFIDDVVYCNILRSMRAAFIELERAMFTVATAVRLLTIITPGP